VDEAAINTVVSTGDVPGRARGEKHDHPGYVGWLASRPSGIGLRFGFAVIGDGDLLTEDGGVQRADASAQPTG
jgi:hypothetical protein